MSNNPLDIKINSDNPSKFGKRQDTNSMDYMTRLKDLTSGEYDKEALSDKKNFVGVVLRVENSTEEGFEPGSMPQKKYAGKGSPPTLSSIKVRIPELHYMIPNPNDLGSEDCQKGQKCHHPIIDMYPTFYAKSEVVPSPNPGDLVRVAYRDLASFKDPIYLAVENQLGYYSAGLDASGASATAGAGVGSGGAAAKPTGKVVVPTRKCQELNRFYGGQMIIQGPLKPGFASSTVYMRKRNDKNPCIRHMYGSAWRGSGIGISWLLKKFQTEKGRKYNLHKDQPYHVKGTLNGIDYAIELTYHTNKNPPNRNAGMNIAISRQSRQRLLKLITNGSGMPSSSKPSP